MKDLVKTEKEFKEFTPTLKDMLCRLYNYIEKFSKERDYISFTEQGLYNATGAIEITGRCSEKYANIFLANLDQIKLLSENQPTTVIQITFLIPNGIMFNGKTGDGEDFFKTTYSETYKTYSNIRYNDNLRNIVGKQYYHSHRIIEDGRELINSLSDQTKR